MKNKSYIHLKRSVIVTLSRITSLHQTFLMTEGTFSCSLMSQGLQQMDLHLAQVNPPHFPKLG